MSFIANTFASLPFGTVNAANEVSIALMAAWYGVLFALLHRRALSARLRHLTAVFRSTGIGGTTVTGIALNPRKSRYTYTVTAVWLIAAASLIGFVLTDSSPRDFKFRFFETNRGDMILVETPSGTRLLIDGGDDSDLAVQNLESVLPPLDRRIDVVLSTHPDADHMGGLQRIVEGSMSVP